MLKVQQNERLINIFDRNILLLLAWFMTSFQNQFYLVLTFFPAFIPFEEP